MLQLQKSSAGATVRPAAFVSQRAPLARSSGLPSAPKQSVHSARAVVCAAAAVAEETKVKLSTVEYDDETFKLTAGYHWYETMMILNSTLSDEDRDKELAKFEAYLNKEDCQSINALVRARTRMAYPIKGEWEGIYVLYTYAAKRQTAKNIQLLLSKPEAGSEGKLLRHITFFKC